MDRRLVVVLFLEKVKPIRPHFQRQRWFIGFICLLSFLSGASGLLTEFCAVVASLDQSHSPVAGFRDGGGLVVLTHSQSGDTLMPNGVHQHGLAARALCALAIRNWTQPDHRLEFVRPGPSEISARTLRLDQRSAPSSMGFLWRLTDHLVTAEFAGHLPVVIPPRVSDSLCLTRSIVLLI